MLLDYEKPIRISMVPKEDGSGVYPDSTCVRLPLKGGRYKDQWTPDLADRVRKVLMKYLPYSHEIK